VIGSMSAPMGVLVEFSVGAAPKSP
jgi:hypothetical protein